MVLGEEVGVTVCMKDKKFIKGSDLLQSMGIIGDKRFIRESDLLQSMEIIRDERLGVTYYNQWESLEVRGLLERVIYDNQWKSLAIRGLLEGVI